MLKPSSKNAVIILTVAEMLLNKVHDKTADDIRERRAAFNRIFPKFVSIYRSVDPKEWNDFDPDIYPFLLRVLRIGIDFDMSGMIYTKNISENLKSSITDLVRITKKHI